MTTPHNESTVVVLLLPDLATAERAADDVRTSVYEGRIDAQDWVIAEHTDGKVRLHHNKERGAARGFGAGAVLGGLAGIFIGAVVGPALLAGAAGAALTKLHHGGISSSVTDDIGAALAEGRAGLFILTDANSARIITAQTFANSHIHTFTLSPDDAAAIEAAAADIAATATDDTNP